MSALIYRNNSRVVYIAICCYFVFRALKDGASHPAYRERYKLLFGGLVSVMGKSLREEVEREELLVKRCHNLAELVKNARSENRVWQYPNSVSLYHDFPTLECDNSLQCPVCM